MPGSEKIMYKFSIMKYDYTKSKIVMYYLGDCKVIDGTTSGLSQRIYTLRHYYTNESKIRNFFENCQIKLIEEFPCKTRIELSQRIKHYEIQYKIRNIGDYLRFPNTTQKKIDIYEKSLKRDPRELENVSLTVRFD